MKFNVYERFGGASEAPFPHVALRWDNWDDFGYKTMLVATLFLSPQERVLLGTVKILRRGQESGRTPLAASFEVLDEEYCSLGQDVDYYDALAALPVDLRNTYLSAMRDAATHTHIEEEFRDEEGWSTSLLRFGQASSALEAGKRLVTGEQKKQGQMSFAFEWPLGGSSVRLPFRFDDAGDLPGRCNVLIGYNGAGKTRVLAEVAQAASRYGLSHQDLRNPRITGEDTDFARVIAISYSAFDTFETPSRTAMSRSEAGATESFGYVYCGLRKFSDDRDAEPVSQALKSIAEIETEFSVALRQAGQREEPALFLAALDALAGEPSFGRIGVDLKDLSRGVGSKAIVGDFQRLSTGHKVVLNIVTQLAAHLRQRSLVLIDEPETHLHPPLTAALLKAIQLLLHAYDSFAVIATHSPVVLQEVPAQFVQVLERIGTRTWVRPPAMETFAESVGVITRQVFSLDSSSTDYQGVLAGLAERMTLEQIEALFPNGLSSQGRALVLNYLSRS